MKDYKGHSLWQTSFTESLNRTDLKKCTTNTTTKTGNNNTHTLSTNNVFTRCKKIDRQQKRKDIKKRTDKKVLM